MAGSERGFRLQGTTQPWTEGQFPDPVVKSGGLLQIGMLDAVISDRFDGTFLYGRALTDEQLKDGPVYLLVQDGFRVFQRRGDRNVVVWGIDAQGREISG